MEVVIKPAWKSVLDAVRREYPEAIFFLHSCGNITPVVEDVVEIGFHVLHPVQPECMDPASIKERFGDRIVPCATLGAQRTLARGTPDEVAAETTRLLDTLGADRRCLVCPSNRIQPETPWENVLAPERAVRKHPLGDGLPHPLPIRRVQTDHEDLRRYARSCATCSRSAGRRRESIAARRWEGPRFPR